MVDFKVPLIFFLQLVLDSDFEDGSHYGSYFGSYSDFGSCSGSGSVVVEHSFPTTSQSTTDNLQSYVMRCCNRYNDTVDSESTFGNAPILRNYSITPVLDLVPCLALHQRVHFVPLEILREILLVVGTVFYQIVVARWDAMECTEVEYIVVVVASGCTTTVEEKNVLDAKQTAVVAEHIVVAVEQIVVATIVSLSATTLLLS